jgi:hypothetical protein
MARSTCRGCGAVFSGLSSFDLHRTGAYCLPIIEHGKVVRYTWDLRRCIVEEAMIQRGLTKNDKGIWTVPFDAAAIVWGASKKSDEETEDVSEIA